jgi:anti-sigma B factor antagonist
MSSWAPLRIRQREAGPVTVVQPVGRFSLGPDINNLRTQFRDLLNSKRGILVDLAEVTSIDSTGIGVLVEAQAHAINVGGELRLCNLTPAMSFQISRLCLERILKIYETEAAALADW